jgi:hypothetical protein
MQKMPGQRYRSLAALERDLAHLAGVESEEPSGGCLKTLVFLVVLLLLTAAAAWWFQGHYSDSWRSIMPEWAWRV